MENLGQYTVYLTGTKKTIKRNIHKRNDGTCWIIFYRQWIEVKRGLNDYYTVESY